MDVRDKLNTFEGYKEIIEKREAYIQEDLEELENEKENWAPSRLRDQYFDLFSDQISLLKAKYSIGTAPDALIDDVKFCISLMEKSWKAESGYVQLIWILSMGIMLEIENKYFETLKNLADRENLNDFLVDFLLKSKIPEHDKQSLDFEHKTPYKATSEIVELAKKDKDKAVERLKSYLSKEWYKGHSDMGWYNSHKSKWNVHTGYWSFESGALVIILGLDDSPLKDIQYYPYDMVHWKD
jgi:hypothetical protein